MEFVSFEIAKKLKEKGFDVPCIYAYCEKGGWNMYTQKHEPITYVLRTDGNPFGSYYVGENWNKEYKTNKNKIQCSAPTISQVLKWLRKEKKILITIIPQEKNLGHDTLCFAVYKITEDLYQPIYNGTINTLVDSYEELYLAGIEYVLDNLI
jgi:hypothetical protein